MSIFVKFEGGGNFDGEVKDTGHEGWIDCTSFNYGNERPSGESATGQTRRRSDVTMKDVTCEKEMDVSSLNLCQAVATGQIFSKVMIHFTATYTDDSNGPARKPFHETILSNVMVTSFEMSGSPDEAPTESFSLNYEKIEMKYHQYDDEGKKGGEAGFGWDVPAGVKL